MVRHAALNREFAENHRLIVTASYAMGLPGYGRRLYTLAMLDIDAAEGGRVRWARRLGRLTDAASPAAALMPLAHALAQGQLPDAALLAPFLPPLLLDAVESDTTAADFPEAGADREHTLPEPLWERLAVLRQGKIDATALAYTLNLAPGERATLTHFNPASGDYRVYYLSMPGLEGGTLLFELHRQGPERRVFSAMSLALGAPGADGLCPVAGFACDSGAELADLPRLLTALARIAAALQEKRRPDDALVLPFLSRRGQILWNKPLLQGAA